MADDIDPTARFTPPSNDGRRSRWWLVVPVALAVALVVGVGAVLVSDGGDASVDATSAGVSAERSATTDDGAGGAAANPSSGGGPRSGTGATNRAGTSTVTGAGATTTSSTATTVPAPPKPVFTSATTDPDTYTCTIGSKQYTYVSWATTNATSVTMGDKNGLPPVATKYFYPFTCGADGVTLVAHGPGGDTTRRVNWRWQEPQP